MNKEPVIKFENNCFDLIKYWSAFCVMFLHYTGYILNLSDSGTAFFRILRTVVSFFPGVVVLFAVSGYLVSSSFERSKSMNAFLKKRILRLYPELWICTIVNFVFVSFLAGSMLDSSIFLWLVTQIFGIANTPECLKSFATSSINGSLWTIFVQIQFFFLLMIGYNRLKKFSLNQWFMFMFLLCLINISCEYISTLSSGIVVKLIERMFLPYLLWFCIGIFCYQKRTVVLPVLVKYIWVFCLVYFVFKLSGYPDYGYYAGVLTGILCPAIAIGAGYKFFSVRLKCDLTYEIFLYHWIVLNIIVHFQLMNRWNWILCLLFFFVVTIALSYLSWRYIGKGIANQIKTKTQGDSKGTYFVE